MKSVAERLREQIELSEKIEEEYLKSLEKYTPEDAEGVANALDLCEEGIAIKFKGIDALKQIIDNTESAEEVFKILVTVQHENSNVLAELLSWYHLGKLYSNELFMLEEKDLRKFAAQIIILGC